MPSLIPPPATLPPGSIVDAYLRDSGGPLQDRSIEQQRNEITDYCTQYGLRLRNVYADVHKSGGSTKQRDQFESMIAVTATLALRPAGLLIWNFARFARNVDQSQLYKALLRTRKIVIHSLTDNIPEGPFSSVIETLIDTSNELKRQEAAYGAWRGLRHVVRQGAAPGTPPRGFVTVPITVTSEQGIERHVHGWKPDPNLIPLIRQAFTLKAAGESLSQIHEKTHLFTTVNSYRTFFLNQIYIGTLEYGELAIEDYCAAIIDRPLWDAVQKRLAAHAENRNTTEHPRRNNSTYLLSGLIYCARCGSPMHGNTVSTISRKKRGENYRCSKAKRTKDCDLPGINRRVIEDSVIKTLQAEILTPENIQAMHALVMESVSEGESNRAARRITLASQRRTLSGKIVNITSAIADGGHSEALISKLKELEAQRNQINNEIAGLDTPFEEIPKFTDDQLEAFAVNLSNQLTDATNEKVRTLLRGLINKVVIDKTAQGDLVGMITYYYPPPFESPPADPVGGGECMSLASAPSGPPSVTVWREKIPVFDESNSSETGIFDSGFGRTT